MLHLVSYDYDRTSSVAFEAKFIQVVAQILDYRNQNCFLNTHVPLKLAKAGSINKPAK